MERGNQIDGGAAIGTPPQPTSTTGAGATATEGGQLTPAPRAGAGGSIAVPTAPTGEMTHPDGSRVKWETTEQGDRLIERFDADGNPTGSTLIHGPSPDSGIPGMIEEFGPGQEPAILSGRARLSEPTVTEQLPDGRTRTASSDGDLVTETITNPDGSGKTVGNYRGDLSSQTSFEADGSSVYESYDTNDGTLSERIVTDGTGQITEHTLHGDGWTERIQ